MSQCRKAIEDLLQNIPNDLKDMAEFGYLNGYNGKIFVSKAMQIEARKMLEEKNKAIDNL